MPSQTIANNAAHIAANAEIVQHLTDAAKLFGPFVAVIIAMGVWAWKRMEKTQDKLEQAFIKHVQENDELHDKLFTELREVSKEFYILVGDHTRNTCGDKK